MKRRIFVSVVAVATATLLAACSSTPTSTSDTKEPIRLAIVYGVTGANSSFVGDYLKGVDAAVKTINNAGGVKGRPIKVEVLDDKSDPTHAVSLVTDLIAAGDLPDAIFPGGTSAETLALLPLTSEAGLFSVSSAVNPATNNAAAYPFHFGQSPTTEDTLKVTGVQFKKDGVKTVGVVLPGNATGDAYLTGFTKVMDDAGVKIVQVERPDPKALNFTVEMQRIQAAHPDAIFWDISAYDAAARLLEARVAVGATDIPLYGGYSAASAPLGDLVGAEAMKNCSFPVLAFTVKNAHSPENLQPLYDAFKGAPGGVSVGGFGWDTVQLAAHAFEDAKDTGAQSLTDALIDNKVPAGRLALFGTGTSFTKDNRFPPLDKANMALVPCDTPRGDGGVWKLDN
jgi:branched-chain amino acid transport system substrate-binding protein